MLPAAAALMALGLEEAATRDGGWRPVRGCWWRSRSRRRYCPRRCAPGSPRRRVRDFQAIWLAAAAIAVAAWWLEARGRRLAGSPDGGGGRGAGNRLSENGGHAGAGSRGFGPRYVARDRGTGGRGLPGRCQAQLGVWPEFLFGYTAAEMRPESPGLAGGAGGRRPGRAGTESVVLGDDRTVRMVDPHSPDVVPSHFRNRIHDSATELSRCPVSDDPQPALPGIVGERFQVRRQVAVRNVLLRFRHRACWLLR